MYRKKVTSVIAIALAVVIISGVALPGIVSAFPPLPPLPPGFTIVSGSRVADPDTSARSGSETVRTEQMGFINIPGIHDGRIWADKTVRVPATPPGQDDEFIVTLSALSQTFSTMEGYTIPSDTVIIIDVSGSMREEAYRNPVTNRLRIDELIEALNEVIDLLQEANPQNRIAVVAYGGVSGGYARVENLLPLDRFTTQSGNSQYFSFVPNPSQNQYLRLNALRAEKSGNITQKNVVVFGSTPTQWGIFAGARILEEAEKTTLVDVVDEEGKTTDQVLVTRRPNIILMTDGEPTMAWTNYTFAPSPANPVTPGPAGAQLVSSTAPPPQGVFFGDGSYGEMGVSLLTVLTAAHRKREVHRRYFPSGWPAGGQVTDQPSPSVGFYTIAFGKQPEDDTHTLIKATMNPGVAAANADAVKADVRLRMSNLTSDEFYGVAPGVGVTFTPNLRYQASDEDMGVLLRRFAATVSPPEGFGQMEFHAARRQVFGTYVWDTGKTTVSNSGVNLTAADLHYATLFGEAENLDELRKVFREIATSIQTKGSEFLNVTDPHDYEDGFGGYLVFSDVIGDYMQVRNVTGIEFNDTPYTRDGFAAAIRGAERARYLEILREHMNYGTNPSSTFFLSVAQVTQLVDSNLADPEFDQRNSLKYYANRNRDFVGNFFSPSGAELPPPPGAAAIVEVFPMHGELIGSATPQLPPSEEKELRLITFHVITALGTARFEEIFANAARGDRLVRELRAGDQMIRWYIPANLIPLRDPDFDAAGVYVKNDGNDWPIRVNYTVGLNRKRVEEEGVPWSNFSRARVPGASDQMYFYSNRHNANGRNVTLAFYEPHPNNPFYNLGVGGDTRGIIKSANPTQTAAHVTMNRVGTYRAGGGEYDMHWLGNNGRFTIRLDNPPRPPPSRPPGETPPAPQTGDTRDPTIAIVAVALGILSLATATTIILKKTKKTPGKVSSKKE
jgi:uncharacterized protein YegL